MTEFPSSTCPSFSCLCDKVCICCQIFVKLAQIVYLINSFNPLDFEKNPTNNMGKSHFRLKISISCLSDNVCICCYIFLTLTQFVYLINSFNPIDLEKNPTQFGKSIHFKLKISNSCLHDKVCISFQIFMKITQFVYLIRSFNPIGLKENPINNMGKVAISS